MRTHIKTRTWISETLQRFFCSRKIGKRDVTSKGMSRQKNSPDCGVEARQTREVEARQTRDVRAVYTGVEARQTRDVRAVYTNTEIYTRNRVKCKKHGEMYKKQSERQGQTCLGVKRSNSLSSPCASFPCYTCMCGCAHTCVRICVCVCVCVCVRICVCVGEWVSEMERRHAKEV